MFCGIIPDTDGAGPACAIMMKGDLMLKSNSNRKLPAGLLGALLMVGSLGAPGTANAASIDTELRSAVQRLIMNIKEGPVSKLSEAERKELAGCIYNVMSGIPEEKKEYIIQAKGHDELRARFDKVGLEDQAALKQQISRDCAP
jgi:hypothetical protein